jgi:hypothetical protein
MRRSTPISLSNPFLSISERRRAMARSPQEVFQHHGEALTAEDLEGIVSDYSDDALFITPDGVRRGKEGVRKGSSSCSATFPARAGICRRRHSRTTFCCSNGRPSRKRSR